jgi:hypothetical protein
LPVRFIAPTWRLDRIKIHDVFLSARSIHPRRRKSKQAEKSGKEVTSVTRDGVTLNFGEPGDCVAATELDKWMKKKHARQT